ncbi:MAG TPA: YebC/PmpR family DNA-binding transcriptional regulator [bacterium]|jgi:YebC/PmpR family DNA-binding regulatory protein|nr:YebC/PmpR family DNA-binding transcriptional regulator [bacterium]HNT65313.1 YebC/PmpR family DNA-binding transcriptional regulator [bacterium]HOX86481.1 YebC/PmpR family DNA-binding transcriptional regulator [bacterium]HPG46507.1 YebC/PmpR family DNA-binding transcriptional regulator [bacterium]HPM98436.1 YebC/PmpR family DNA-binding transcriptional regulator [bacterium]
MSGHSKWSTIKRKKEKTDAARGRVFTRLIKEITIAARNGGGDEESNPRLRTAVLAAKAANMPATNIDRAVKRGTGELPGVVYEEIVYEGYGPGGAALYIETLTDNKNRTVAEMRHMLSRYGGSLGESGSVAWMFNKKGIITVPAAGISEDNLMEATLEAGVDDIQMDNDYFTLTCAPNDLEAVKSALEEKNIEYDSAEVAMQPNSTIKLEGKQAESMLKLMDVLEEHDDLQNVYSNFDIDDSLIEELG